MAVTWGRQQWSLITEIAKKILLLEPHETEGVLRRRWKHGSLILHTCPLALQTFLRPQKFQPAPLAVQDSSTIVSPIQLST